MLKWAKDLVRRVVDIFYEKKEILTLKKLKLKLQNDHNLTLSKTQLWRTLHQIGFVYKKNSGNSREVMCERSDLVSKRCDYLRKIREYRREGRNLVYLDETWLNAHHTKQYEWLPQKRIAGRKIPSNKGERLIILHAGKLYFCFTIYIDLQYLNLSTSCAHYVTLICVLLADVYMFAGPFTFTVKVKLYMLGNKNKKS